MNCNGRDDAARKAHLEVRETETGSKQIQFNYDVHYTGQMEGWVGLDFTGKTQENALSNYHPLTQQSLIIDLGNAKMSNPLSIYVSKSYDGNYQVEAPSDVAPHLYAEGGTHILEAQGRAVYLCKPNSSSIDPLAGF